MSKERAHEILRAAFDAESSGNMDDAIKLFKRAARFGSNEACSKLGTIYDDVIEPPRPTRAVYWYKRAVEGGDASCAWNLSMHYAGTGRKRGYLHWLRIAAKMGDPDAEKELADRTWWERRNAQ